MKLSNLKKLGATGLVAGSLLFALGSEANAQFRGRDRGRDDQKHDQNQNNNRQQRDNDQTHQQQ